MLSTRTVEQLQQTGKVSFCAHFFHWIKSDPKLYLGCLDGFYPISYGPRTINIDLHRLAKTESTNSTESPIIPLCLHLVFCLVRFDCHEFVDSFFFGLPFANTNALYFVFICHSIFHLTYTVWQKKILSKPIKLNTDRLAYCQTKVYISEWAISCMRNFKTFFWMVLHNWNSNILITIKISRYFYIKVNLFDHWNALNAKRWVPFHLLLYCVVSFSFIFLLFVVVVVVRNTRFLCIAWANPKAQKNIKKSSKERKWMQCHSWLLKN